jgi:hypothetical protein
MGERADATEAMDADAATMTEASAKAADFFTADTPFV